MLANVVASIISFFDVCVCIISANDVIGIESQTYPYLSKAHPCKEIGFKTEMLNSS